MEMNQHLSVRSAVVKFLEELPKAKMREMFRGYNPCTSIIMYDDIPITITFSIPEHILKEQEKALQNFSTVSMN